MTSLKDLNSENLEPSDTLKHATEARQILNQTNQDHIKPDPRQLNRILSTGQGYCLNSPSLYNLLNTAALGEQNSFWSGHSQTAGAGCDGEMLEMNRITFVQDQTVLDHPDNPILSMFWKVTFSQPTSIKTTAFINRDDAPYTTRFSTYIVTFGNGADVRLNPFCVTLSTMTDGGWYMCPSQMTGTVFGIYATTENLNLMEAMAYSQEAIQLQAGVTVSFLGTNSPTYPASNALQKIVVLLYTDTARQKCVQITPPAAGKATFSMKFLSQNLIKTVVLLPGYALGTSPAQTWPALQTNVAVYAQTQGGNKQLCEVIDYYTKYNEALCNFQANEIVLEQQNTANNLVFCGFGALADCDCSQASLDPGRFTTPQTPLASVTSLSIASTDSVQTIQITKVTDTVSTSNGCASCGPRSLSFKDKQDGYIISTWPYRGYSFDATTLKLTLDPALADAMSEITVIISLTNYPSVQMSQDITVTVSGAIVNCDCTQSRFSMIPNPLVSKTSLSLRSTDSVQNIQITQLTDTVSSACGLLDGFTQCGSRSLSFTDKQRGGVAISTWPYRGYNFDTITSILTLNPALADAISVLTVTLSLTNYQSVKTSQDITATVFICDCTLSSFSRIPTPLASPTSLVISESVITSQISKLTDNVSSNCGSADGFTQCGIRLFSFMDKKTGFIISTWPYNGYNFEAATSILTLDPALADVMSVITVTISLTNYPSVNMSQDITVTKSSVNCDCALSQFSQTPKPLAYPTQLILMSTDVVQTIQISKLSDTVSSNCGSADGFTQCGPRSLSFTDIKGIPILKWPYKGYNFYTVTSFLTFDPAQTDAVSGLIVTISLLNYPLVRTSQAIRANVLGPKLDPSHFQNNQNETASFQLPNLGETISVQLPNLGANNLSSTAQNTLNQIVTILMQGQGSTQNMTQATMITVLNYDMFDMSSENSTASKANSSANKTEDQEPAVMYLKKISNRGNLTIQFSKEVFKILNVTDWKLYTEIIIKQSEEYSYNTSFTIFNMTSALNLTIFLNFSAPLNVSASSTPDKLSVRFNLTMFTHSNQLPVIYLNDSIEIPMQLSGNEYEDMMINAVSGAVDGMNALSGSTFVTSMFVSFGLGQVLGDIKGLTVICTLYCANLQFPALAREVGSQLLRFVQFDLFDCDPLYDHIFGADQTQPYTGNFGSAGYGSRQLVRIMGSLFIISFIYMGLSLLGRILLFVRFLPAPLRSKISNILGKIYWNYVLGFIKQNYIMLVMGSLLNITNIEMVGWSQPQSRRLGIQTLGITVQKFLDFHAIFSIVVFAVCIAAPVTFIGLSYRNFKQLKNKTSKQSLTWGAQMRNIRIKRVVSAETDPAEWTLNSYKFKLTKSQAILASSISYLYELLVILVLLCLNNHPWAQLTALNVITIAKLMCFLYLNPFEQKSQNRSEFASQALILVFVVTMRCFTDWIKDTQTRQYAAYAHIVLLLVFILVMILPILKKLLKKLKLVLKLMTAIYKRKQFLTDLSFVFRKNDLLSKCIQTMLEKQHKEKLSKEELSQSQEKYNVHRSRLSSRINSQLRFDSSTDLIAVKMNNQKAFQDPNQLDKDRQSLLARIRKLLELSEPKQLINMPFSQISSYYRNELSIFKEVNKKNMSVMMDVLNLVRSARWPYGMAHIQEIKLKCRSWTELDLEWKWLDYVPIDFYKMEREVQSLFVRDILLQQVASSRPEVRRLERQIRDREEAKMDRAQKQSLIKDFAAWHSAIDDFQEYFVGKYKERLEILNSTLYSWPSERLQSFMQYLEDTRSKSNEIGYIEYLQNLHMVTMEILTGSLDQKRKQPEKKIEARIKKKGRQDISSDLDSASMVIAKLKPARMVDQKSTQMLPMSSTTKQRTQQIHVHASDEGKQRLEQLRARDQKRQEPKLLQRTTVVQQTIIEAKNAMEKGQITLEEMMIRKRDEEKRSLEEKRRMEVDAWWNKDMHDFSEVGKREEKKRFLFGEAKTRLTASDVAEIEQVHIQEQLKRNFSAQMLIERPWLQDFSP